MTPLRAQLASYLHKKKQIRTAEDVDLFLKTMETSMVDHSYYNDQLNSSIIGPSQKAKIRKRISETANYFKHIQSRVAAITKEPRTCLVN